MYLSYRKYIGHSVRIHPFAFENYSQLFHCELSLLGPYIVNRCTSPQCHLTCRREMAFWGCCLQDVAYLRRTLLHGINFEPMCDCTRQVKASSLKLVDSNFKTVRLKFFILNIVARFT